MTPLIRHTAWTAALLLTFASFALGAAPVPTPASSTPQAESAALTDKPLAAFQTDLLELAFDAATKIPVNPHIKDRSRTQAEVVATCLTLEQPKRALSYIPKIDNWQRLGAYGDLAFYLARHDADDATVHHYIELASQLPKDLAEWRADQVNVKIAQTLAWLGDNKRADKYQAGVADFQNGKVDRVRAMQADEESYKSQLAAIDKLVVGENFDLKNNGLDGYAALYDRFYADAAKRQELEKRITDGTKNFPGFIVINLYLSLSESARKHDDQPNALRLVNEAQKLFDAAQWPIEFGVPMRARLAGARGLAGDKEKAKADADATLKLFHEKIDLIVNIYRGGALRPLAEAYQAMGDTASALAVYKLAVDQGVLNPNSRPRAEDLSATCRSMAIAAVEPDAELWARMRHINEELKDPW
ncbi:MAG: hypothetical protein GC162_07025 [Planctomycetes bacterium]|nr:hypothetical protein [Planctomycetota bacterium]